MSQQLGERFAYFTCIGVIIASLALFFFQLGAKPFWDYDEAIYANVVHDTLQSGDFLTPHFGDGPWFEKPPLSFWLSIEINKVFHNPEFSYRLTAAMAGILSVIMVMLIAYEISGDLFIAAIAGLILLTTGTFLEAGREFRLDIPAIAMISEQREATPHHVRKLSRRHSAAQSEGLTTARCTSHTTR
jgi:4-amino-4-deoxy-L-arabinose transferase-like glycosyltransferase